MQQIVKNSGLNRAEMPYPLKRKQTLSGQIKWISKKIAITKAKLELLTKHGKLDIFTSLRSKIGKVFTNWNLESNKRQILKNCQQYINPIWRVL